MGVNSAKRKNIVIFYAWGTVNAGDHALIMGALEMLSTIEHFEDIVVISRFPETDIPISPISAIRERFPSVNVIPPPFDLSIKQGWKRVYQFAIAAMTTLGIFICPSLLKHNHKMGPFVNAITSARFVILNGGNLFFWHKLRRNLRSILRLAVLFFPIAVARRFGTPYGMLPQTCGPFDGIFSHLIGSIFEKSSFVAFRDSDSLDHLRSIANIDLFKHALLPDLAYFLSPSKTTKIVTKLLDGAQYKNGFFCVCLRNAPLSDDVKVGFDNPQETERKILSIFPQAIADFQDKCDLHCVIVVQVDHDRPTSEKLLLKLRKLKIKCSLLELKEPYDFITLYSNAHFIVSFRLHSMIFALSQGTPAIGIWRRPLGTKIPSMMHDMELDEYSIELVDANGTSLLSCMKKINNDREFISNKICKTVNARTALSFNFFGKIFSG
jgi:colanic acid/amylovoran biosynthesis protein